MGFFPHPPRSWSRS